MGRLIRYPIAFILAVLIAEVLGAIFQVQGTIRQQFAPFEVEIPLSDQLSWTLHDIAGLFPQYAPLLAAAFLIAFVVAGFVSRLMPGLRTPVFAVAGAVAVFALFKLSKLAFWDVTFIYGGRDALGLGLQCLAGAVGGFVFAVMIPSRE